MSDGLPVARVLDKMGLRYEVREVADAWALCPLHGETQPSFHVDLVTGRWFCYGCQRGGGLFDLVREIAGDDLEAFRVIRGQRAASLNGGGFPVQVRDPADPLWAWSRFRRVDWRICDGGQTIQGMTYRYLVGDRGFEPATLNGFDVRLTDWDEYPAAFALLERDKIVGYVRRRITSGDKKYLYNRGFDSSNHVGYFSVDDSAPCLVVEGWLDLMKAAQWGYPRIACLFGWRMNATKRERLRELNVERVVWATDNTDTGRQGWAEAAGRFRQAARFEFIPDRKDVGDLSRHEFLAGIPEVRS